MKKKKSMRENERFIKREIRKKDEKQLNVTHIYLILTYIHILCENQRHKEKIYTKLAKYSKARVDEKEKKAPKIAKQKQKHNMNTT